ncbi:hypothetical protein HRI_001406800 [Hibiscus trionum]|uniref:Uncharacterized protein n=1 Tax=Hibiscus trionum TaxID=183268 RepID=A0A9W7LW84_HIBTR|nr:hypothetical protein HRI_001406800 [Hibiscus trionum]
MGTVSSVKAHGGSPKSARSDFHPLKRLGFVHSNLLWSSLLIAVSFYLRFSFLFQLLYVSSLFCYSLMFYSDPLNFLTSFLLCYQQIQTIVHATILLRSKFYLKILGSSSAVDLPFATLSWVSVHLLDNNVCGFIMDAYTAHEPVVVNCSILLSISG